MNDDELIQPVYKTIVANGAILLGRSSLGMSAQGQGFTAPVEASLRFQPSIRLVLEADLSSQPVVAMQLATGQREIQIQYGPYSAPTNAVLLGCNMSGGKGVVTTSTATFMPNPERLVICPDRRKRLSSVTFHVLNFPMFFSSCSASADLRQENASGGMQRLGRTILKYEQWQVELQTLPHAKDLTKQLDAEGGYAITHVGRLTRQDGRSFRISHGDRVLADLHYFLSFARGLSTTPVLPVGFDAAGSRIFEEWGMRLVTAWEPRRSWFDTMHGQCLADLYPGFMDLLRDADLGDSVRTALYWYLRSNRAGEGAGVDSGVILSQAALERLASAYLPFSRLPTVGSVHERLRRAFKHMKLPVAIPNEMRAIAKGKRNKDWKDLPQALTKVRNELTHPQARLKVKLGDVVADVWDIAQWYVELSILRLCGYNGVYSNRLRARWVGQVEEVPWQRRKARKR